MTLEKVEILFQLSGQMVDCTSHSLVRGYLLIKYSAHLHKLSSCMFSCDMVVSVPCLSFAFYHTSS